MSELGIYEKALPTSLSWLETLELVKSLGFDFYEFSIDESDQRLARLDWDETTISEVRSAIIKSGVPFRTLMLSGHRRYPLGSQNPLTREKAMDMGIKAINLATKLGIRHIQLAGYDVFYESRNKETNKLFLLNLSKLVKCAASKDVMLDIETMDDSYINSVSKIRQIKKIIHSPWLQAYPDLGNLSAWPENNVPDELVSNLDIITHIHLKDTLAVTPDYAGKFKNVSFGKGCVDFEQLFDVLSNAGYDGCYTIEMWSGEREHSIEEIKEALSFFRPLFKKYKIGNKNVR